MSDLNAPINESLAHDHSELDELLAELFAAFEAGNAERIFKALDFFWARLAMHIRAEHLHLFPAILGALERRKQSEENIQIPPLAIVKGKIAELQDDHNFFMRELLRAIKQMRGRRENKNTDFSILQAARETVSTVKRRLAAHNEREEKEIYKWADRLLTAAERANLNDRMQKELENLPPRFGKPGMVF